MKVTFMSALAALSIATAQASAATPVTGWQQVAVKSFVSPEAFYKSQGVTSDGSRLYFSWNAGLHSTDLTMETVFVDNVFDAIPYDMKAQGSNHIGDLDYYDGQLYAPIEDVNDRYPTIVMFDPDTLQPTGQRFHLDWNLLPTGVPWVAIDPVRQVAYTSKWLNTGILNVHRLSDFEITSTVQLSRPVPRIQGAKVYKGLLYAARDNGAEKSIEAIDPETGEVTNIFDRNLGTDHEAEGIAFVTNDSGTTMLTEDIDQSDYNRVDVHSYRVGGDVTPPAITGMTLPRKKLKRGKRVKVNIESSEAASTTATWSRCIGRKKRPCGRLKPAGQPPEFTLEAGSNKFKFKPRSTTWAKGKRFRPGRYRLSITPTDQADAIGVTSSVTFKVLKPRRKHRVH
ncbi:MAG: hypothetical protein IPK93_00405 [Solirubrobacterales bacterium]|nr:hypothetical protein [Solirubrobacterales bacterium]